jgi:hypothetical protein
MRLFHFSDDPSIQCFKPRPVRVPAPRAPGMQWLNGPLVWAIDDWHQPLYLFPRECPRILIWPGPQTSAQDRALWWGERTARMLAHIEAPWQDKLNESSLYRYELPHADFEPLNDAGMFVSRSPVVPLRVVVIESPPLSLAAQDVELEIMPSLLPLRDVWQTSMSASGIRLRNAHDWP